MKGLIGLMVLLAVLAVALVLEPATFGQAQAVTAVTPAKINPAKNTVIYFGGSTFITGKVVDTLVWSSTRKFKDTLYTCAVFLTPGTALGILRGSILNDSSIVVTSSAAADSLMTYWFQVVQKKK